MGVFIRTRHVARVVTLLCAAIALLVTSPLVTAQVSSNGAARSTPARRRLLLGVNMHPLQFDYARYGAARPLGLASGLGVSVVRIDVQWSWLEYEGPGQATWDSWMVSWLRPFLATAGRLHIKVLATIVSTPCWASSEPGKQCPPGPAHYRDSYPPRSPRLYAAFLNRFLAYVGHRIQYYEIWNEPNLASTWTPPDPAAYTRLLKAAYRAIKARDPAARVLAGATSGADAAFIRGMYAAGAKGYFDALSIHPYTGKLPPSDCSTPEDSLRCGVEDVRAVMKEYGDNRPIWLTEFGQQVSKDVSPDQQASYVTEALAMIRRWPFIPGAIWYQLFDNPTGHGGESYGLYTGALEPRPAAGTFEASAGR